MTSDLFLQLCRHFNAEPDRRGEVWADCPNCGKKARKGTHFSFSARGGHCFVCGFSASLSTIAELLSLDTGDCTPPIRPEPRQQPIARWRKNPDALLAMYRNHPQRVECWSRYKPLSRATLDRFDFGLGRLPFQTKEGTWRLSRSLWLTIPLWEDGELVGLRGRNVSGRGPKWISATGTNYTLWNVDNVRPGSVCWLTENCVDAAWIIQEHPDWSAVAINGCGVWKPEWATWLAERRPQVVIVALDRDLPGQAEGAFRRKLEREWLAKRGTRPPAANGPRIANSLLRAGVNATLFRYPEWAPEKADIGWILAQERKQVAA